jgi:hypothetical protein
VSPRHQEAAVNQVMRGEILKMVSRNHREQRTRMNDVLMAKVLRDLGYDVGQDEVVTVLQDLGRRGYLAFREERDKRSNRVSLWLIEITPLGQDVIEKTHVDPAVTID